MEHENIDTSDGLGKDVPHDPEEASGVQPTEAAPLDSTPVQSAQVAEAPAAESAHPRCGGGFGGHTPPHPPYPGADASPAPIAPAASASGTAKRAGRAGAFLWGMFGGLLGSGALAAVLAVSGVLQTPQVPVVDPAARTQSDQTISIVASDTDVSVAKAVAAKALRSVVAVRCTFPDGASAGSGVILDTQGNIITNNHVVEGAQSITVTIEGETYDAEVVGTDPSSDIAVIKVDVGGAAITPVEVGDSAELVPGDWVMTVGSPFGLDSSVSSGIVSSLYRNELMYGDTGNTIYANLIQVDAAINPGNSGGALVNSRGQLVGICTLFSSDTQSFAGIGFAIPGNYAVEIAQMIINGEPVTHAYIGLSMQTVTEENAAANGLSVDYGAYVAEVIEEGPAESAGLKAGDVVIAIAGERIESADGAVLAVRSHRIGETVTVTVMRGNERLDIDVVLGSDEKLQELQQQQLEQQQMEKERQNEFWNREDDSGNDRTFEDYINRWLEELTGEEGGR